MYTGYKIINGKVYYFNENKNGKTQYGALVTNGIIPRGFMADANGVVEGYNLLLK